MLDITSVTVVDVDVVVVLGEVVVVAWVQAVPDSATVNSATKTHGRRTPKVRRDAAMNISQVNSKHAAARDCLKTCRSHG